MFGFFINIQKVKREHTDLFVKISEILIKYDPAGVFFGSNNDEYDIEVAHIIKKLRRCNSENDVLDVVWKVLKKWFSRHVIKNKSELAPIAQEIWDAWNKSNK